MYTISSNITFKVNFQFRKQGSEGLESMENAALAQSCVSPKTAVQKE